jgi:3'-5' exonuclease
MLNLYFKSVLSCMNVFVFDIETIPDIDAGRRLYGNPAEMAALSDEDVGRVMMLERQRQSNAQNEMVRLHLQRIVAISVVLRTGDKFKVWSLGTPEASEAELIQRFFDGLGHFSPTLVSWNGSGFDLPVLHYRALLHGISAPRYWQMDGDFRWNNYLNRYHDRHTDLMDLLALYQARAYVPLDEMASLLGFPGKLGMSGDKVWDAWLQGGIVDIRHYCETDVLNTYLIYLRFQLMRGHLNISDYADECTLVRTTLRHENKPHFDAFLAAWPQ